MSRRKCICPRTEDLQDPVKLLLHHYRENDDRPEVQLLAGKNIGLAIVPGILTDDGLARTKAYPGEAGIGEQRCSDFRCSAATRPAYHTPLIPQRNRRAVRTGQLDRALYQNLQGAGDVEFIVIQRGLPIGSRVRRWHGWERRLARWRPAPRCRKPGLQGWPRGKRQVHKL